VKDMPIIMIKSILPTVTISSVEAAIDIDEDETIDDRKREELAELLRITKVL
jgi:hypothetical protein